MLKHKKNSPKWNLLNLLFSRVGRKQPNGCILWTGGKTKCGYPIVATSTGLRLRAHRLFYAIFVQPIPADLDVLHACDNPSCICPTHLVMGTHKANMEDMARKGRSAHGSKNSHSKLNEIVVRDIYILASEGEMSQQEIADCFCINQAQVSRILHRTAWVRATENVNLTETYL